MLIHYRIFHEVGGPEVGVVLDQPELEESGAAFTTLYFLRN
jgi:hypothetical protein